MKTVVLSLGMLVASTASAFLMPSCGAGAAATTAARPTAPPATSFKLYSKAPTTDDEDAAVKRLYLSKEEYLAGLPEQGKTMQGAWEYVLVERMEKPTQTTGGLFLPTSEKDPLYVVRIVSVGGGIVGESGVTAANEGLSPGDIAFTKQPWGIGPRDDLWEARKFSFVRYKDILARVN